MCCKGKRKISQDMTVLSEVSKDRKELTCLIVSGSWFQVEGPWYGKERCPKVFVHKDGKNQHTRELISARNT